MPTLALVDAVVLSMGVTVAAMALLGPDASEKQRECVEALGPTTKDGVQQIVQQCRERYPD